MNHVSYKIIKCCRSQISSQFSFSFSTEGKWRVWIATNENPAAGTDATVYMVVYGDKGKTDDIILGAGDGYFEAGNEDEFTVSIICSLIK